MADSRQTAHQSMGGEFERELMDVFAHDLRAGMVPIKTYAQMLGTGIMGDVSPQQKEALEAIDRCVQKQVDRVTAVLDIIKSQEGRLELQMEWGNLADLLQSAVSPLTVEAKRRSVVLNLDLDTAPAVARIDPPRIRRILAGLVSRALRRAQANDTVSVELRYPQPQRARVRIWDTSKGPPDADVAFLHKSCRDQAVEHKRGMPLPNLELGSTADILRAHRASIEVQLAPAGSSVYILEFLAERR